MKSPGYTEGGEEENYWGFIQWGECIENSPVHPGADRFSMWMHKHLTWLKRFLLVCICICTGICFYKGAQTRKQACQCRIGGFAYFELRHFIRGNIYATFAPAGDLGLS